jgi:ABC-type nickel/cobalt efflux system permease component RcnA
MQPYVHEVVWHGYNVLLVGLHSVAAMSVGTVVQLLVLRTHTQTVRRKGSDGPRPGQMVRRCVRTVESYMVLPR